MNKERLKSLAKEAKRDALVKKIAEHVKNVEEEAWKQSNHSMRALAATKAFYFEEGLVLEPELRVKIILDYLKEQGLLK